MKKITLFIFLVLVVATTQCKKQAVDTPTDTTPIDTTGVNCNRCNQPLIGTFKVEAIYIEYNKYEKVHYFYGKTYPKYSIYICDSTKLKGIKLKPTIKNDTTIYVMNLKLRDSCLPGNERPNIPYPYNAEVLTIDIKK